MDQADGYDAWEAEVYEAWSADCDQEHLDDWKTTARTEFSDEEIARMDACDWILLL